MIASIGAEPPGPSTASTTGIPVRTTLPNDADSAPTTAVPIGWASHTRRTTPVPAKTAAVGR